MTLRVAILTGRFPTRLGGTESLIASLCPLLAERGVEVTVVSRENPAYPPSTPGATVVHTPARAVGLHESFDYVRTAVRTLGHLRPDVIHAQSLLRPTTAAILARWRLGIPVVATVHGGGVNGEIDRLGAVKRGGRARLRFVRRGVDRFVVISEEIDGELDRIGIERQRRHFIPNGVDTTRFAPAEPAERRQLRASLGLGDEPTAVYVGRMIPGKGLDTLLACFDDVRSSVPDARLVIVGDGARRPTFEALAGDGVEFVGAFDDVSGPLRAGDVFVLPSKAEGLPLSLLEAMASGLAVLSTDVGAIADAVGGAGRIVPPDAPDQLTEELARLLSDPALRARLGAEARRRVMADYDLERTADELVSVYEELGGLGSTRSPAPS